MCRNGAPAATANRFGVGITCLGQEHQEALGVTRVQHHGLLADQFQAKGGTRVLQILPLIGLETGALEQESEAIHGQ